LKEDSIKNKALKISNKNWDYFLLKPGFNKNAELLQVNYLLLPY